MSTIEYPMTWTAKITYYANEDAAWMFRDVPGETVNASPSESDLQKSMASAAYGEACQYILAGCARVARVQLYKTTKAHGTVKDHTQFNIDVHDAMTWALKTIAKAAR